MKSIFSNIIMSLSVVCALLSSSTAAQAQSEVSTISALSALPIASVVTSAAVGASAVAGVVIAVPVALSTTGAVLIVKTVESTARGTICVLERASDGARVSVEFAAKAATGVALLAGTSVVVTVLAAGTVLSTAGEAIAFIPNALGKALLYNERQTY